MDLKIKDVADLLHVSESTIRRWLTQGKIPAYKLNHEYRFDRNELEAWVLSQRTTPENNEISLKEEPTTTQTSKGSQTFSLYRAIHRGGIYKNVPATDKQSLIKNATALMATRFDLDAEGLSALLLDREQLSPTALNNGIAVPHTRDFLLPTPYDAVGLVFPQKPIPYGALDGKPVHALFFVFACKDSQHLHLLSKIAYFCQQSQAAALLKNPPSDNVLLASIKDWESHFSS